MDADNEVQQNRYHIKWTGATGGDGGGGNGSDGSSGSSSGGGNNNNHHPPPEPCPRCKSPDTKFSYYNNYSSSQARFFCKDCRRYWTRGGTLRNIPIGGGCYKKNKRPKIPTDLIACAFRFYNLPQLPPLPSQSQPHRHQASLLPEMIPDDDENDDGLLMANLLTSPIQEVSQPLPLVSDSPSLQASQNHEDKDESHDDDDEWLSYLNLDCLDDEP